LFFDKQRRIVISLFFLFISDAVGKEAGIFHGQDYEQTEICSEEGSGYEKFSFSKPGSSNCQNFSQSYVISESQPDGYFEWLFHLSYLLSFASILFCSSEAG
jgi:hypothetical protein